MDFPIKYFNCNECSKQFDEKSDFENHLADVHEDKFNMEYRYENESLTLSEDQELLEAKKDGKESISQNVWFANKQVRLFKN